MEILATGHFSGFSTQSIGCSRPVSVVSGRHCVSSRSASSAIRPLQFAAGALYRRAPREKTDDPATHMKSNLEPAPQGVLAGLVERVIFHNPKAALVFSGRRRAATAISRRNRHG
jgi:hypothetical protein